MSKSQDTKSNSSHMRNRDAALAAMRRAAKVAHRRTAARGEKIAIGKDGKIVWIDPIVNE